MALLELYTSAGTKIFNFLPTPFWRFNLGGNIEYDEMPLQRNPDAYDSFSQSLNIEITGIAIEQSSTQSASGTNQGLKTIFNKMRAWKSYDTTGNPDPSSPSGDYFKLRVTFADVSGYETTDYIDFNVILEGAEFDFESLPLNFGYRLRFREVNSVMVL